MCSERHCASLINSVSYLDSSCPELLISSLAISPTSFIDTPLRKTVCLYLKIHLELTSKISSFISLAKKEKRGHRISRARRQAVYADSRMDLTGPHLSRLWVILYQLLWLVYRTSAKAVFAHFMVLLFLLFKDYQSHRLLTDTFLSDSEYGII